MNPVIHFNQQPSSDNEAALEVEEAELSSDAELPHPPKNSRNTSNSSDDDFVLEDDDDDVDDDSQYQTSHAQSPDRDHIDPNLANAHNIPSSSNHYPDRPDNPHSSQRHPASPPPARYTSNSPGGSRCSGSSDASDYSADSAANPSDEDEVDDVSSEQNPGRNARSNSQDADVDMSMDAIEANGNDDDSNSEVHSSPAIRKGGRHRAKKLVIPEDMKDDGQFFRRSSRARNAPERLSISPDESSSESLGNDSEFNVDGMHDDEEDEEMDEIDDIDDDDYNGRSRQRRARGTRSRRSAPGRRPARQTSSEREDRVRRDVYSESDSDGDWRDGPRKKTIGHRRRGGTAKRRRPKENHLEDEEVARTARINARTGDAVNYCESDDDLLDSDEQAMAADAQKPVDDGSPRVEFVLDYRRVIDENSQKFEGPLFSDFNENEVEFKIKWLGKSYRTCTWETWATLQQVKGHKKVSNFIKIIKDKRDYFVLTKRSPEEEEENRILLEENRIRYKSYEVIDRVIAQRETETESPETEYLVKWYNTAYSECTWEPRSDLSSDPDLKAIDDYKDREQQVLANAGKRRYNPFNREERPRFKKMLTQPTYLHGEGRTLRNYQLEGLNFLAFSWTKRNNVILADEMGLGKTLQTISFLGWLTYMRNVTGPFLVVVPLSTVAAWVREFARWVPDMNVVCYTGDGPSRAKIREYEFWSSAKTSVEKFHVLLITPELLMHDQDFLDPIRWAMIAVDEAHRLKNETSSLHITLASLRSADRLLITGTPLQNSVRELWALLHFLNREHFGSAEEFEDNFSFAALRDPERVANLHKTLRPYIIRRQKTDVEKSLPKKTYAVLRVGMTSAQQQYYRWLLTKNFAKLNVGNKGKSVGVSTLRNLVMELKKCCNHPYLFPNYEDTSKQTTVDQLTGASGKLFLLDKLLIRLKEKGHRVLIFSQMVRMLDILQDYCRMRNFQVQRLDGSIHNEIRQRAVDHFNAPDSNDFVFLLSTRAGGLGINLATADTVIIFDSDWNPQNDLQAESRAHRIGQKRDVKVFRLLCRDTVEETILERAKRKRVLEHLVIHGVEGGDQADAQNAFKKEELSAILRFGAENLFDSDKDSAQVKPPVANGVESDEPTAMSSDDREKDGKAEEKRVLEIDNIDELLARAPTDEDLGGAQPSLGDSLLNAFKWADFKIDEEEEEVEEETPESKKMAMEAANRVVARENAANRAKLEDEREQKQLAQEGDHEFWNRVIPGDLKDGSAIPDDVVFGTRKRKRNVQYNVETPEAGQSRNRRRRSNRGARINLGKAMDIDDLSEKEQKSFLRSLRRFGDPSRIAGIIKDAGLEDRLDDDLASTLFSECIDRARLAVDDAKHGRPAARRKAEDSDPEYTSKEETRQNGKESKSKSSRILFDVLGERAVDAADLLKRCEDLQMLRKHIQNFDPDTQFRFRRVIKLPSYNVRWKGQNDAMLMVGVCRHGFGNWAAIANDKQLGLADKISVAGNLESKPGAPDTTKITRRVLTLLKEVEKEVRPAPTPKKGKSRDKDVKPKAKRVPKITQKKISKTRRKEGGSSRFSASKVGMGKREKNKSQDEDISIRTRMELKSSNIDTLKELRALSKENSTLNNSEKIKRTKDCLLKLGQAIDEHSEIRIREDLWRYVHEVCRTNLAGDRLQGIYERLAGANTSRS